MQTVSILKDSDTNTRLNILKYWIDENEIKIWKNMLDYKVQMLQSNKVTLPCYFVTRGGRGGGG